MALVRWRPRREWDPFADFLDLRDEVNRLINSALTRTSPAQPDFVWAPPVDIHLKNGSVIITADLPGLKKEDVDISVQNNVLTIKGEKKRENEYKDESCYCVERTYGAFQRSLDLPTEVESSKVKATYKEGVLEIVLPQAEAAKPKKIKVDVQ